MSEISSLPYRDLWEDCIIRSVANLAHPDTEEFIVLLERYPLQMQIRTCLLEQANEALAVPHNGNFDDAIVLLP